MTERSANETARLPARPEARRPPLLDWLPAYLILAPFALSAVAWLSPVDPKGLTGFLVRSEVNLDGMVLLLSWLAAAVLLSVIGFSWSLRSGPLRSLSLVSLHQFHLATAALGTAGTAWVYWNVTGGSISTLVELWTKQEFYKFGSDFDYGAGPATLRYAAVLAGGISLYKVLTGRRLLAVDAVSLILIVAAVFLNSRLSALMALAVAVSIIGFTRQRRELRVRRVVMTSIAIVVVFVYANYSRNANFYEANRVTDPGQMALINAQSYLATPMQVTIGVADAVMEDRAEPDHSPTAALAPVLPPYLVKAIGVDIPQNAGTSVETRYQGSVQMSLALTTNGAMTDTLMINGWWGLIGALVMMPVAGAVAGRFVLSGPVGAAVGGAVLYGFVETWRVFLFNLGVMHFIVLLGIAAAIYAQSRLHETERSSPRNQAEPVSFAAEDGPCRG